MMSEIFQMLFWLRQSKSWIIKKQKYDEYVSYSSSKPSFYDGLDSTASYILAVDSAGTMSLLSLEKVIIKKPMS